MFIKICVICREGKQDFFQIRLSLFSETFDYVIYIKNILCRFDGKSCKVKTHIDLVRLHSCLQDSPFCYRPRASKLLGHFFRPIQVPLFFLWQLCLPMRPERCSHLFSSWPSLLSIIGVGQVRTRKDKCLCGLDYSWSSQTVDSDSWVFELLTCRLGAAFCLSRACLWPLLPLKSHVLKWS